MGKLQRKGKNKNRHLEQKFEEIMHFCNLHSNNIRIDTHRNNSIMRHLIDKYGFKYCGIVHIIDLDYDYERLAYQKY